MHERRYQYSLINGDLVIYDVRKVNDPRYNDGIMYTFRCMSVEGKTLFAIENSHGQTHIHWREKKETAGYDWETAVMKFEEMLDEHKRKIGQVD